MLDLKEIIEMIENDIKKVDYIVIEFDVSNLNASDIEYLLDYFSEKNLEHNNLVFNIERYDNKVYLIVKKLSKKEFNFY